MTIPDTKSSHSTSSPSPYLPLPHRAYRRIQPPILFGWTALIGFVLYALLLFLISPILNHCYILLANQWLSGSLQSTLNTPFGPWVLQTKAFDIPFLSPYQLFFGVLASATILFSITQFKSLPLWLRHILGLLSGITLLNSLFLFFTPSQFVSGDELSLLYVRTQILVWIALPLVAWLAAVCAMLPRWCWLLLPALWLAIDFIFSIIRFMGWSILLKHLGATISPLLYFFTGPLLDALLLVSMFSIMLYFTSRHLSQKDQKWSWL